MRYRGTLGILISGTGSNMQAIVRQVERSHIPADILFVGSDNPNAPGLVWARQRGLPTFVVDYRAINKASRGQSSTERRRRCESQLLARLAKYDYDLLCLAGFMRLLSPALVDDISPDSDRPCIMNIHPALLPAFPGVDGYGDTWRYGCKVGGCTVHFVDHGEDTGPIIDQRVYIIEPDDTLDSVRAKGLKLEYGAASCRSCRICWVKVKIVVPALTNRPQCDMFPSSYNQRRGTCQRIRCFRWIRVTVSSEKPKPRWV